MSSKRFKEIKNLSKDELLTKIRETEKEFFESRMKLKSGQLENTAQVRILRKDLARAKTRLTEMNKEASAKAEAKA